MRITHEIYKDTDLTLDGCSGILKARRMAPYLYISTPFHTMSFHLDTPEEAQEFLAIAQQMVSYVADWQESNKTEGAA